MLSRPLARRSAPHRHKVPLGRSHDLDDGVGVGGPRIVGGEEGHGGAPYAGLHEHGVVPPPPSRLPLPTLLSQVLVAHTIELDNLAELRLPHHTSGNDRDGGSDTPWLVSYVCWANVLRYVGPDGLTVAALRTQARSDRLLLEGLRRWRYLRLIPPAGKPLAKPFPGATLRAHHPPRSPRPGGLGHPARQSWTTAGTAGSVAFPSSASHGALATVFTRLPMDPADFLPVVFSSQEIGKPGRGRPDHPAAR